ncbi:MAG: hypothetical protein CMJ24_06925 [Phycisphaerae bacterium]|nr:hypothetical protein [Phycisphaerae bacterium]
MGHTTRKIGAGIASILYQDQCMKGIVVGNDGLLGDAVPELEVVRFGRMPFEHGPVDDRPLTARDQKQGDQRRRKAEHGVLVRRNN